MVQEKDKKLPTPSPQVSWDIAHLTYQEVKILRLCSEGLLTKEIAEKLSISPLTVRKHRQNSYRKLGLRNTHDIRSFLRLLYAWDLPESTP